ncbi:MAG TPA: nitroreductase family protein [Tenuifilaceae bacterium]|nr:nitroreductase family protein [Tenuifilaceae bacterium]
MEKNELFYSIIQNRQSDRSYTGKPVEKEKLQRIIESARIAPSACNAQPWRFIIVDNPELKNKLADTTSSRVLGMNHFTKQAPIHIVIVMESANLSSSFGSMVKRKHFPLIDIGIAAEHICLAATAEGLGSCMIGWFDEAKVKKLLSIPNNKRPVLIITLGYPSKPETREKRRKTTEEIVQYNKY